MGGCSDDGFDYFLGWLVAQGKEVYHSTLENPEFLASYIPDYYYDQELTTQLEEMLSVSLLAYCYKRTGQYQYNDDICKDFMKRLEPTNPRNIELTWEVVLSIYCWSERTHIS